MSEKYYTGVDMGNGQKGLCAKCKIGPTKEGHDGCLGTLPDTTIMNACCGHGNDNLAYIQYWGDAGRGRGKGGRIIEGIDAIAEQAKLINATAKG